MTPQGWNERFASNTFNSYFRIQEKVAINRQKSPCYEDSSSSKYMRKGYSNMYLNGKQCRNISGVPCMIPQVKDLLSLDEQKLLQPCSSWYQYNCMLMRLMLSGTLNWQRKSRLIYFNNFQGHRNTDRYDKWITQRLQGQEYHNVHPKNILNRWYVEHWGLRGNLKFVNFYIHKKHIMNTS